MQESGAPFFSADFMDTVSGLFTEHNVIDCGGFLVSFVRQLLKGKMSSQLLTQVGRVMHIQVSSLIDMHSLYRHRWPQLSIDRTVPLQVPT
uniref:Uncharacterized protein n=1 Tax=Strigops habroptila TaxID=2489341 RepID=A0A672V7E6_STRHB